MPRHRRTAKAGQTEQQAGTDRVNLGRNGLMAGVAALAVLAACAEREVILPGERFPVRAPLEDSVPVEGEPAPVAPEANPAPEARDIALPATQSNADWAQRGGGARHAAAHVAFSSSPVAVWTASIGRPASALATAARTVWRRRLWWLADASLRWMQAPWSPRCQPVGPRCGKPT